ncbi:MULTISPECIES: KGK domain-containing protein [unclassified Anabaena]|uniref:KGK domain-containing protein n=1 Tax=unclassified Anabaena TaxID=2619674 RepID=UPI00082DBE20|nr:MULTISPECIES: KGK domain-containing protein [unclassified Anabaena]
MNDKWETLNINDDVIHFYQQYIQDVYNTQIAFQLLRAIQKIWSTYRSESESQLFDEGLDCYVLAPGKTWRKGKIRLRFEFLPDESEPKEIQDNNLETSPLDDLREKLKNLEEE